MRAMTGHTAAKTFLLSSSSKPISVGEMMSFRNFAARKITTM